MIHYLILPLSLFAITAIETMGLQLILGGAGLLTLGHAAFFAVGGYASASAVVFLGPILGLSHPCVLFILGSLSAMLVSSVLAFLLALPCLRLRGDYFAAASFGFGQIIENILFNFPALGGASGFTGIPRFFELEKNLCLIAVLVLICGFFLKRFYQTGLGQAILCSRDDEVLARCFGIFVEKSKLLAFVLGSAMTGLAGALYVHTFEFISPTAASFQKSVEILLALVLGGMFSIRGSLMGAALLILVPELLRILPGTITGGNGIVSQFIMDFFQNTMLIFSIIVLFILRRKSA